MLLRKLVAALCPLLLCIVLCLLYRWLDGVLGAGLFWSFLLKGAFELYAFIPRKNWR